MRAISRALTAAAALVPVAALGATLLAGPASAAPLAPESFTITGTGGGLLTGLAFGPVHGFFIDHEVTATDGIWLFAGGTVSVRHTAVNGPTLNPATCTGFAVTRGRWLLNGLTGNDAGALGAGRFTAILFARGLTIGGTCDPNRVTVRVFVTGTGFAENPSRSRSPLTPSGYSGPGGQGGGSDQYGQGGTNPGGPTYGGQGNPPTPTDQVTTAPTFSGTSS